MGKIWLKSVDPNKQCCGCEGKTGPCDSCCSQITVDVSKPLVQLLFPFNFLLPITDVNTKECQFLSTIWDKISRSSKSEIQIISNPSDTVLPNGFQRQIAFNISLNTGEIFTINGSISASSTAAPNIGVDFGVTTSVTAGIQSIVFQPVNGNLPYQFTYVPSSYAPNQDNGKINGSIRSGESEYFPHFTFTNVLLPPIPNSFLVTPSNTKFTTIPFGNECFNGGVTPILFFDENTASAQGNTNVSLTSKSTFVAAKAHNQFIIDGHGGGAVPFLISEIGSTSYSVLCSLTNNSDIAYYSSVGMEPPLLPPVPSLGITPGTNAFQPEQSLGDFVVLSEGDVTYTLSKYSFNFTVDVKSKRTTAFSDTFSLTINPQQAGCYQVILPCGFKSQPVGANGVVLGDFSQTLTYDIKSTSNLKITNLKYVKDTKTLTCPFTLP